MRVALFLQRFRDSRLMKRIMSGIRPACIGLIFGVALSLSLTNYQVDGQVNIPYILLGLADVFLLLKAKWSVPAVIGSNALAGILLFGILGL